MAAATAQFWTDLKVNLTPDTVDVRTASTVNNFGERTFTGSTTTYDAYIMRVDEAVRNAQTDLADVEWIVYIPDDSLTLAVDDELTLPAPVSGIRPVVRVNTKRDPNGQVAVVAYCGTSSKRGG